MARGMDFWLQSFVVMTSGAKMALMISPVDVHLDDILGTTRRLQKDERVLCKMADTQRSESKTLHLSTQ
jgi:hypothetical protein